jgi:hypothetical protein
MGTSTSAESSSSLAAAANPGVQGAAVFFTFAFFDLASSRAVSESFHKISCISKNTSKYCFPEGISGFPLLVRQVKRCLPKLFNSKLKEELRRSLRVQWSEVGDEMNLPILLAYL